MKHLHKPDPIGISEIDLIPDSFIEARLPPLTQLGHAVAHTQTPLCAGFEAYNSLCALKLRLNGGGSRI